MATDVESPMRSRGGYLLLPVSLLLAAIAAAAYAIILLEDISGHSAVQIREAREAVFVARAGMAHARLEASSGNCANYELIPQPFGEHSYTATYSPASGSPVDIQVTATHASGAQRILDAQDVTVYEGGNAVLALQPGSS